MIDLPERSPPRFPPELVEAARIEINRRIARYTEGRSKTDVKAFASLARGGDILFHEFNGTLLAAMRSPGLHELVAAEQLHMPVRLRRVESTSDLQDTELADILTSAFLNQPWHPWDIGSTLCSAEVETTDQLTPTLEGVGQKVKRTECLPLNDNADD